MSSSLPTLPPSKRARVSKAYPPNNTHLSIPDQTQDPPEWRGTELLLDRTWSIHQHRRLRPRSVTEESLPLPREESYAVLRHTLEQHLTFALRQAAGLTILECSLGPFSSSSLPSSSSTSPSLSSSFNRRPGSDQRLAQEEKEGSWGLSALTRQSTTLPSGEVRTTHDRTALVFLPPSTPAAKQSLMILCPGQAIVAQACLAWLEASYDLRFGRPAVRPGQLEAFFATLATSYLPHALEGNRRGEGQRHIELTFAPPHPISQDLSTLSLSVPLGLIQSLARSSPPDTLLDTLRAHLETCTGLPFPSLPLTRLGLAGIYLDLGSGLGSGPKLKIYADGAPYVSDLLTFLAKAFARTRL